MDLQSRLPAVGYHRIVHGESLVLFNGRINPPDCNKLLTNCGGHVDMILYWNGVGDPVDPSVVFVCVFYCCADA